MMGLAEISLIGRIEDLCFLSLVAYTRDSVVYWPLMTSSTGSVNVLYSTILLLIIHEFSVPRQMSLVLLNCL